jgi:hypothetical protein
MQVAHHQVLPTFVMIQVLVAYVAVVSESFEYWCPVATSVTEVSRDLHRRLSFSFQRILYHLKWQEVEHEHILLYLCFEYSLRQLATVLWMT